MVASRATWHRPKTSTAFPLKSSRISFKSTLNHSSVVVKAAAATGEPALEFSQMGFSNELLVALQEKQILQPTEIQASKAVAWPGRGSGVEVCAAAGTLPDRPLLPHAGCLLCTGTLSL